MTWHCFRKNRQVFCSVSLAQAMSLRDTMVRAARSSDQISEITSSNILPFPAEGVTSVVITEHPAPHHP